MPVVRTGQPASAPNIILKYGERKVLVRCPPTYEAALAVARAEFELNHRRKITLHVDMGRIEPGSTEGLVEITARAWEVLDDCKAAPVLEVRAPPADGRALPKARFVIHVDSPQGRVASVRLKQSTRIRKMLAACFAQTGLRAEEWRVMYGLEDLADFADLTVGDFGMRDGDAIQCAPK
ncbi:hypothetical protein AURDEDRAFT_183389 [Auricularia subglabra TFB-10046 SS5]|nr:hypothetical protein AURDEDRAFT_183389 [Auricularia subglabra TFB-10046 SS5]